MPNASPQSSLDRLIQDFSERADVALNSFVSRYQLELGALVLVVAVLAGAAWLGVELIAVPVLIGLLVASPSRRWLAGKMRGARRRRQWDRRVTRDLGWTSGGHAPELLEWDESPERVRVALRPLPDQGPRAWPDMADGLRRWLRGSSVVWRESHGVLWVQVALVTLPHRLAFVPGTSSGTRLVLGVRQGGGELALDVARTPHVLLAGATGSGKGGTIRTAVAGALEQGWQAVVCDPKSSGEYRWMERLEVPVLRAPGEQLAALERVEAVREHRQQVVREHGADDWLQLPRDLREGWRPVLVVLDEAADILVVDKGADKDEVLTARRLGSTVLKLVRKGRSAGVHVVVAIQRPDVAQLGEFGGSLRNNLVAKLALGRLDADGVRMLGIASSDPVVQVLDGTRGRGVCSGFDGDPRASACQVAWLDQGEAWGLTCRRAGSQGLDALAPAAGVLA